MRKLILTFLLIFILSIGFAQDSTYNKLNPFIKEWSNVPYKFGGTSKKGIDCSAFIKTLYKSVYDIDIPRTCKQQIKNVVRITKDQLDLGTLIFFKMGRDRWHVGMYLYDGFFIHSGSSKGVSISSIESSYWSKYIYQFGKIIK